MSNRWLQIRAPLCTAALLFSAFSRGQTPAQAPEAPPSNPAEATAPSDPKSGGITEDELRQKLAGKTFYLRGGYLDNALEFDEHGRLASHSPTGSYTLCLIQIDKVHLAKHRVELTGVRYGLHFLGALPKEDPASAMDRVRITPKKKQVRITFDRELVVTPKKKKEKHEKGKDPKQVLAASSEQPSTEEEARAAMAAAPEADRPANATGVTTTTSPAHAKKVLEDALDAAFAPSLDSRLIATLPDFWKLYYQAAAAQSDYVPTDSTVLRQNQVDQKARLTSPVEPASNEYAQNAGVAGMALYHAIIGSDGKPREIVVGRPIGFGLDESAADSIRKASYEPAVKDGKTVPVLIDLVVQFRIYSNRTNQLAKPESSEASAERKLPGPYSLRQP
ncbi:MAG: energy transducer TonB [Terracidiphilus sp.]|nr:energy transducer TonB [Terracidiphilus sp.]